MLRTIIFILVACIGLALALTRCAPERSGTLAINPSAEFPADKKADLGRAIAKILPVCPGISRVGNKLAFNNLSSNENTTEIIFAIPDTANLPAQWGKADKPCIYNISDELLTINGSICQAVCLGRTLEPASDKLEIKLTINK